VIHGPALYLIMLATAWLVGGWATFLYAERQHKRWVDRRRAAKIVNVIAEAFPEERHAIERLVDVLRKSSNDDAFTTEALHWRVGASSTLALIRILFEMSKASVLESFVVVELPTGERRGPYASVTDVPNELADVDTGKSYRVMPEDLRVYHKRGPRMRGVSA